MATPRPRGGSDELLSSPDPLNDTVSSALYPSSRRVTRSQRSQRLFSLGGSSTSPRKQMFELEVGDDRQPKRLLVTVEAEGDYENVGVGNVGRRLFNADTPTLSRGAFTTTVPLAGDRKNTAVKTPARRGRPPKSAGTPKTGTATKRRATASPRKTPRQARRVKTITDSDGLETDITIQGTPRSTTRPRRATSRQPSEVPQDPAPSSIPPSTTRRRGRPKRVEFSDQPVETVEDDVDLIDLGGVAPSDDGLAASMEDMIVEDPTPRREPPANLMPQSEPDIWMQTMSDQATPRASTQENPIALSPTPAYMQDKSPTPSEQLLSESENEPAYNEYDFAPGAPSDISSLIGDNDDNDELRDQDTVAQGEDFSMIFANSIPSMRGHMSMHDLRSEDVGEETGLIVNQTLETLRRSGALHIDDDEDEIESIPTKQPSPVQDLQAQEEEVQSQQEIQTHVESVVDTNVEEIESPVALPSLPRPDLPPPSLASKEKSPSRGYHSPGRARSSPRRKSIPLGRQLMESKVKQMDAENSRLEESGMDTSQIDNSFSSVPSRVLDAATPGAKSTRRIPMVNDEMSVMYVDDFSEIPEAYLEAATPGRPKLSEVNDLETQNELEQDIEQEADITQAHEETLMGEVHEKTIMNEAHEETITDEAHEETIMNEAPDEDHGEEDVEVEEAEEVEEEARKSSPKSAAPSIASVSYTRSDSARMPTPDDTPSPADIPVPQSDAKTIEAVQSSPTAAYSQLPDEPSSDLPVPDLTASLPAASNEYITPLAPISSPIPSPDVNLLAPRAASPDNGARPTLSPIVRAGRALQSVTSDASSPPRQNSLGSPFRPTTSSSQPQSAAKSTRSWTQPLSTLIQAGAQFFGSPTRTAPQPQPQPPAPQLSGQPFDDPFGTENDHTGQPSFMEALSKSMRTSPAREPEVSFSMSGSLQVAPGDEVDEMSWMQEAPAPREQPFAQSRLFHSSTNTASRSMHSRRQSFEISLVSPDRAEDTEVEEEQPEGEEEEDDDIWAVEASRPASNSDRQQSFAKKSVPSLPPRRAAIPSPWQKSAEPVPKQTLFTPAAARNRTSDFADGEVEDFSMLSQQQSRQKQIPQKAFEVAQRSSAKKDLAAFFSSPNLLPGAEGVKEILDKKRLNLQVGGAAQRPERVDTGLETNSMFPSIPQKAFAPSASGRSDLFSPAKPSATKSVADTYDYSDPVSAIKPSVLGKSVMDTRRELFASTSNPRSSIRHRSEIPDSQPNMSDEVSFPSVPQKKNFTPNVGSQKTTAQNNLFSKAPSAAPVPSLTPVRMQLTRADIQKWQESSASAIAESSPTATGAATSESESEHRARILRPLPDRNMSPTKSCLRSPLKPRTPGRVVEFTSSVLSPLAQAQVRAERRLSASSSGSAAAAQQQQQQRIAAIMEEEEKENGDAAAKAEVEAVMEEDQEMNEDMDVSMTDAPQTLNETQKQALLIQEQQQEPQRLSQTMWSRDHWLLLDDIIQLRREGPFDFEFPDDFTNKSAWLLGRSVNSHGASLKLEQWHLDVVDAFQAEVGVWSEEALAKRVFSLIVGEELRRQGRVPKAPSVRFR
ncbi:hypothetical protein SGCOL_002074 [Colletotrichum sp. CLE4]